ncbi:hypothetical protein C4559_04980 [Candidatus Microgenomates bacterium]|nr:MAG: hypothetical protein C4559_04980 [Candidatus Microgenomates bacterium]
MTIERRGKEVTKDTWIFARGVLGRVLFDRDGARAMKLIPSGDDPNKDMVRVVTKRGEVNIIGGNIAKRFICENNDITWRP